MRRSLAPMLLVLAVLVLTGCRVTSQDDETTAPTPSPPSSSPRQPLPTTLPVGHGNVGPDDVVWAQGGVLHVGSRQWDLTPLSVESLVVVPGGVFFLSGGQLWLTDLVRARATGVNGATRLVSTADASAVRVTVGDPATTRAWDAATGRKMPVKDAPEAPAANRRGPGAFGILGGDGEPLRAFRASTRQRVPLGGVVGDGFELARWTSGTAFYGLALDKGRPAAVIGCDLTAGTCTTSGRVVTGQPVVFESGT
jgi:hypothetical protein